MSGMHLKINLSWESTLKESKNKTKFKNMRYQYSARYITKNVKGEEFLRYKNVFLKWHLSHQIDHFCSSTYFPMEIEKYNNKHHRNHMPKKLEKIDQEML